MSGRINLNPIMIQPPQEDEEFSSHDLAYLIEGSFPSYFDGKPVPEKTSEEETDEKKDENLEEQKPEINMSKIDKTGGFLAKSKPAKIFLISSSDLLKDNLLDEEGLSTNAMFIMSMLDVLNDREDIAVMRNKEQGFNPLNDARPLAKVLTKAFNIVGLPVLVILFGFFILLQRRAKRKRIQIMFDK